MAAAPLNSVPFFTTACLFFLPGDEESWHHRVHRLWEGRVQREGGYGLIRVNRTAGCPGVVKCTLISLAVFPVEDSLL